MENREYNILDNQLLEETADVSRSKELFEYEMTEVRLMLAGRFKRVSAEDMNNAGADVVVKKAELHVDESKRIVDCKPELTYPQIKTADTAKLRVPTELGGSVSIDSLKSTDVSKLVNAELVKPENAVELEAVELPKAKSLGAKTAKAAVELDAVEFPKAKSLSAKTAKAGVELEAVELPKAKSLSTKTAKAAVELEAVELPKAKSLSAKTAKAGVELEAVELPKAKSLSAKTAKAGVELDAVELPDKSGSMEYEAVTVEVMPDKPQLGKIKSLSARISAEKPVISIATVPAARGVVRNPKETTPDVEIKAAAVGKKSLPLVEFKPYKVEASEITVVAPKQLKPIPAEPIKASQKPVCLPAQRTLKHGPVSAAEVGIDYAEMPDISMKKTGRKPMKPTVVEITGAKISGKHTLENRITEQTVGISLDCHIGTKSLAQLEMTPPTVELKTEALGAPGKLGDVKVSCGAVSIDTEKTVKAEPRRLAVNQMTADEIKLDKPMAPIKARTIQGSVRSVTADTSAMKVKPIASAEDIVKELQSISKTLVPQGLTYEELCERCVVPVRVLDYKPAINSIFDSLRDELNLR